MIPTGLKLYFGIATVALTAAVIGGWSSGGDVIGPISSGWKGGIGDYVSYSIFLSVALVAIIIGSLLTYFRDTDAEEVAGAMGRAEAPLGQRPVAASVWPIIAGVSVGFVAVGLATGPVLVGVGIAMMAMVAFEWTMTAWADRATGDAATNEALRDQLMGPFEIPLLGLLGGGILVLAVSRILLASGAVGAVIVGAVVSVIVLSIGVLFAQKPDLSKNAVTALVGVVVVAVLAGGVWGAIVGPAEHHEEEGEHGGEHSDEDHSEDDHSDEG